MNRIKELRIKAGLTQKELADKTHIPIRTLQNWENSLNRVDPLLADILANHFNVSLSYLLGLSERPDRKLKDLLIREIRKLKHTEVVRLGGENFISERAVLDIVDKYIEKEEI